MFTKMQKHAKSVKKTKEKKQLLDEIAIPEGIQVELNGTVLRIKGAKGELVRDFTYPSVLVSLDGKKLTLKSEVSRKQEKAVIGSFRAHIKNMITGVTTGFTYKLKVVYSHFPITVKVIPGGFVEVSNFFGEKAARRAKVYGNVKVDVQKDIVIVTGINIEEVAQTSANLERATRVRKRDTRVFQDGIYLIER